MIRVERVSTGEVLTMRDEYRQEMDCQIVGDSLHGRGWSQSFMLRIGEATAGYGAVLTEGPWRGSRTLFEFYLRLPYRDRLFEAFENLLADCRADTIQAQTNDPLLSVLMLRYAEAVRSEKILFRDLRTTHLSLPSVHLRPVETTDVHDLERLGLDPTSNWLVTWQRQIAGAGGILFHYNRPYGDIHMHVVESFRRRGVGSFLVQELKRICREQCGVPAARCDPANVASCRTLQKAGFIPCGHWLTGRLPRVAGGPTDRGSG
jgi:GNAT superfamily N-acetyltransferase